MRIVLRDAQSVITSNHAKTVKLVAIERPQLQQPDLKFNLNTDVAVCSSQFIEMAVSRIFLCGYGVSAADTRVLFVKRYLAAVGALFALDFDRVLRFFEILDFANQLFPSKAQPFRAIQTAPLHVLVCKTHTTIFGRDRSVNHTKTAITSHRAR